MPSPVTKSLIDLEWRLSGLPEGEAAGWSADARAYAAGVIDGFLDLYPSLADEQGEDCNAALIETLCAKRVAIAEASTHDET